MKESILIILPGWGGSHETWAEFVELAKPHFRDVHVIDLPCFGDEPCPTEVWGVEEYAHFVENKIATLPDSQKILLGHSFGGAVATYLVANNPTIVDRLVLSGAAVIRPKRIAKRILFGILAKFGTLGEHIPLLKHASAPAKRVLYRLAGSPDYQNTTGIQREIFQKIIRQDQQEQLSKISIPTCVIQGAQDRYVPRSHGNRVAAGIRGASYVVVPDGTHGLHISKKQALLDAILKFLE